MGTFDFGSGFPKYLVLIYFASTSDRKGQGTETIMNVPTDPKAPQIPGTLIGANAFNCHLAYHLFCNQGSARKPAWKPYTNARKISFVVSTNVTDFSGFRNMVKAEINADWDRLGDLVCEYWERAACNLNIKWFVSVASVIGYFKGGNRCLENDQDWEDWKATSLTHPGRKAMLILQMEKPISDAARSKAVRHFVS